MNPVVPAGRDKRVPAEGFGQGWFEDIRFWWRFRALRRMTIVWRAPDEVERAAIDSDPLVGRFGDETIGVCNVDERAWVVRSRDWFGWPDPPQFTLFVTEHGRVWCAVDFHHWPHPWQHPITAP